MASRFVLPFQQTTGADSVVRAGAKLYFYQTGTTTPQNTYSDNGLTVPNANPVIADSSGTWGNIFLLGTPAYKVVLTDANDVTISTADPVQQQTFGTMALQNANAVAITGGTLAGVAITNATLTLSAALAVAYGGTGVTAKNWQTESFTGKTASYTVASGDVGTTFGLGDYSGATAVLTYPAASTLPTAFSNQVVNESATKGWRLVIPGSPYTGRILYPGQFIKVVKDQNNAYQVFGWTRWAPAAGSTFYVDGTNGNDTNDGIAGGSGRAWATITFARDFIYKYFDTAGGTPSFSIADGTYQAGTGFNFDRPVTGNTNQISITGNTGSPLNCVINCDAGGNCFSTRDGGIITVMGFYFTTSGNGSVALVASQEGTIDYGSCVFGNFPLGKHINSADHGNTNILADISIAGNAAVHVTATGEGEAHYGSFTVTFINDVTITNFAVVDDIGLIATGGVAPTFNLNGHVCSGVRYVAAYNGGINMSGGTLPGTVGGSTSNGGYFR